MNFVLQKTSSASFPETFFPDGTLLPYPEANPNFYKQYSVYIPDCSSDLFLGNNSVDGYSFQGARIWREVFHELLTRSFFEGKPGPLSAADDVIIMGGPGIMAQLDDIRTVIPSHMSLYAVCDACLLFDDEMASIYSAKPCTDVMKCPITSTLPIAWNVWNVHLTNCPFANSSCLLEHILLPSVSTPFLITANTFDQNVLLRIGAWPLPASGHLRTFVDKIAEKVRMISEKFSYTFVHDCFGKVTRAVVQRYETYFDPLICHSSFGYNQTSALISSISVLVNDAKIEPQYRCFNSTESSGMRPCLHETRN